MKLRYFSRDYVGEYENNILNDHNKFKVLNLPEYEEVENEINFSFNSCLLKMKTTGI